MKTQKRDYKTPANQLAQDIEPDFFDADYNAQEARWKRKNRVKQLKRSLRRNKEGAMLYGQYDLYLAYRWLQRLKKPNRDADRASWEYYRYKLSAIRGVIVAAQIEVDKVLQKALERENRKEQE